MMLRLLGWTIGSALILSALPAFADAAAPTPREHTLILGRISGKPASQYPKLEAFNSYIVRHLEGTPIRAAAVVIAEDMNHMSRLLRDGAVDYFSETAFTALQLERLHLATVLLHEWKSGVPYYSSFIIAHKDGISSLKELRGKRILFEDIDSTSGFFLAYTHLISNGLTLLATDNPSVKLNPSAVSYGFAGDEMTVMAQVIRRHADAGAVSSTDWNSNAKIPPAFRRDLKIISQTKPMVRSLMLTRRGLDATLKQKLATVLLSMADRPDGKQALKGYFNVDRYERLSPATMAQFAEMRGKLDKYFAGLP